MAIFVVNGSDGTRLGAAGTGKSYNVRVNSGGYSTQIELSYDDAEQLRDHLNEYLIKYWPQDA